MISEEEKAVIDEKIHQEELLKTHDEELRFYEAEERRLSRAKSRERFWKTDARPQAHVAGLVVLAISIICCVWYSVTGFTGDAYGFWFFIVICSTMTMFDESLSRSLSRELRIGSQLKNLRKGALIFCAYWLAALVCLAIPFGYAHQHGLTKVSMFWPYLWYYCHCGIFLWVVIYVYMSHGKFIPNASAEK